MRGSQLMMGIVFAGSVAAQPGIATAADEQPPDAWLTTKAKINILSAVGTAGTAVNVDTVDGRVTLHGTVASERAKKDAEKAARDIEGVAEVRNLLQIVKPSKAAQVEASDEQIQKQVEKRLANDDALEGSEIEVQSVNKGTVLLAGNADSLADHLRAMEIAREIQGVHMVASEIESPDTEADMDIYGSTATRGDDDAPEADDDSAEADDNDKGKRSSTMANVKSGARDLWITSAAKTRLLASGKTPGMDINVDTSNGVVTLFGTVNSPEAKTQAEAEARKVDGVKRVKNQIQVVRSAQKEKVGNRDAEVRTMLETAIADHAALEDADIEVEVRSGVARLTGTVESDADRKAAKSLAKKTSGVRSVRDELEIEKSSDSAADDEEEIAE